MNISCPTCTRPLAPEPMPSVANVRYCSPGCISRWFADGKHRDRRQSYVPVYPDRRTA